MLSIISLSIIMAKGHSTVKVKKIGAMSTEDTAALHTMFDQMIGTQNAELDVIVPKYVKLCNGARRFIKLFNLLLCFADFRKQFQEFTEWFDDIARFTENATESLGLDLNKSYVESDYTKVDEKEFNEQYKKFKNNKYLKRMIITSGELVKYKTHIGDLANLNEVFIHREPGLSLRPFPFSRLDLKLMWVSDNITEQSKKYILTIIHHAYTIGVELFEVASSPDVDISRFSDILVASISQMRKQVPRCDKAFDIIENSVKLLETNFTTYYRTSMEAENPNLIMESFIVDVSLSQKADATTMMQFKRIIGFLNKKTAQIKDPKIRAMLKMANMNFEPSTDDFDDFDDVASDNVKKE
jgi:hypothetical protein